VDGKTDYFATANLIIGISKPLRYITSIETTFPPHPDIKNG
jgi:hypothetical protein